MGGNFLASLPSSAFMWAWGISEAKEEISRAEERRMRLRNMAVGFVRGLGWGKAHTSSPKVFEAGHPRGGERGVVIGLSDFRLAERKNPSMA